MGQTIKQIKGKVAFKHEKEENWNRSNYIPENGEQVIYEPDDNHISPRIKIGNGIDKVKELPFTSEDLPIKTGEGDNSFVINEGVASGNTSIAGGTTDNDIISNLIEGVGAEIVTLNPSKARGDLSIALGADNISNTTGAVTLGYGNICGGKGYYFSAINEDDRTVTLSSDQKEDSPTGNPGWKEGDRLFIINDNKYWLEVAEDTTSNMIRVVELPTGCEQVNYADIDTLVLKPNDKTVINVDRPEAGIIDMGWGSIGIGIQNTVVGNSAYALGYKNIIGGDFGVAFGRENVVGYKSLAVGNYNKAYGKDALVVGKEITVNANRSIVAGYNHIVNGKPYNAVFGFSHRIFEASEGHELISGWDNEVKAGGFGAIIGARGKNIAGNYNIIFGRDNTNTDGARNVISGDLNENISGNQNIITGKSNKVTGSSNNVSGEGNISNGSNVIIGGKGNTASGSCHLIQGTSNTVSTTMHGLAVFGNKNKVITDGSLTSKDVEGLELIVGGENQIHSGGYGAIIGVGNKNIEGNHNIIFGRNNTNTAGARNLVSGDVNENISGNQNIITGNNNKVAGSNNNVSGEGNTNVNGHQNILGGYHNTNDGRNNIVFGESNTNAGSGVLIGGRNNTASGSCHLIQGTSNTVSTTMHGLAVFGAKNTAVTDPLLTANSIEGLELIVGDNNQIHAGGYGAIIGSRNKNIEGNQNLITGADNTCKGTKNILGGNKNSIISGNRNIIAGLSNNVSGSDNLVVGSYHSIPSTVSNALIGGCYSNVTEDTVFAIGNGTSNNKRLNAFEVKKTGDVIATGKLTVGKTPEDIMDVVTKGWVEDITGSIDDVLDIILVIQNQLING